MEAASCPLQRTSCTDTPNVSRSHLYPKERRVRCDVKTAALEPSIFPHNTNWTVDNFGPITIPEAGKTVQLTQQNLPLYKRIIENYEGNTLENNGNSIQING